MSGYFVLIGDLKERTLEIGAQPTIVSIASRP
jgi:hypothetical protein